MPGSPGHHALARTVPRSRGIARDTIRRIGLAPKYDRLVVETDRTTVELSTLGTRDQRQQAMVVLRAGLGISEATADRDAVLPEVGRRSSHPRASARWKSTTPIHRESWGRLKVIYR